MPAYQSDNRISATDNPVKLKLNGEYITETPSGRIIQKANYIDGIKNGVTEYYNFLSKENELQSEAIFENGILHGWSAYYNADGKMEKTEFYQNGKLCEKNEKFDAIYEKNTGYREYLNEKVFVSIKYNENENPQEITIKTPQFCKTINPEHDTPNIKALKMSRNRIDVNSISNNNETKSTLLAKDRNNLEILLFTDKKKEAEKARLFFKSEYSSSELFINDKRILLSDIKNSDNRALNTLKTLNSLYNSLECTPHINLFENLDLGPVPEMTEEAKVSLQSELDRNDFHPGLKEFLSEKLNLQPFADKSIERDTSFDNLFDKKPTQNKQRNQSADILPW